MTYPITMAPIDFILVFRTTSLAIRPTVS